MSTAPSFDSAHPLLLDRPRLERLKNRMYSCIRQVTGRNALVGGEDADDVLSVAVIELLSKPVVGINSWEGLGMTIAKLRAIDAVRRATAGRQTQIDLDDPLIGRAGDAVKIFSLDSDHGVGAELMDHARLELGPEEMVLEAERQEVLWVRAQELFSRRDLEIYVCLYHVGMDKSEVAERFGLTERRVRQLFVEIGRKLQQATEHDQRFPSRALRVRESDGR